MQEISFTDNPQRIDSWLSKQFGYSRNFFHHLIEQDIVKVNGKGIKKSYQLKNGDIVVVEDFKRFQNEEFLEETPKIEIPVVYENQDYLIINKPKGVLSHPLTLWDVKEPSVVGFLYHKYHTLPNHGNLLRSGIIHRLDKNTNGLMIVAKTEQGLSHFKKLFQEKSESESIEDKEAGALKKFYRATCHLTSQGEQFLSSIKTLPYIIQELVVPKIPHSIAKIGITKILDFAISGDRVNLNLEILTGRTHQIRYHLSSKGLPIVGDYLYRKDEDEAMQLTAYKLIFKDIDGSVKSFEI